MTVKGAAIKLLVLDIDNTVFDWVSYYATACKVMLEKVSSIVGVPYATIAGEARDVFTAHGSIEYPFMVQELPSVNKFYGTDIDAMLTECVAIARDTFNATGLPQLTTYADVRPTLESIRKKYPALPIVALTDAPRYVAMWKLNKLGLIHHLSAIYGLADPRIPTSQELGRVKVDPEILLKHLQQNNFGFAGRIRILPDDYEKPGTKGLKTVLMDFDLDEDPEHRRAVVWVGDNLRKDVGLGKKLGVTTVWAAYGTKIAPHLLQQLRDFSPESSVHKNVHLPEGAPESPKPELELQAFGDLLKLFP